jgi:hypothetical protein
VRQGITTKIGITIATIIGGTTIVPGMATAVVTAMETVG